MQLMMTIAGSAALAAAATAGPVIDNDEVSVTDLTLASGVPAPATPHAADAVILFLGAGRVRTTMPDGTSHVATRAFGDAVFVPRGTDAVDTLLGGAPVHEAVVTLKDGIPAPLANTTGLPLAYPRPGAIERLRNDRVTVWNYSWQAAHPTAMHFHDKDVVIAFRYDGEVRSTAADGSITPNTYKAGEIRFLKAARVHTETLTSARESAVMIELKR